MPDLAPGLHRVEHIMGMPIGIDLRDEDVGPQVIDRAFQWFREVDATFSTYRTDSEISRLNRGELRLDGAHLDVRTVLLRCDELREATAGYFEIRVPFLFHAVDPSGFVKGWSVDRAADILETAGARNYSINAGGDVRVRGRAIPEPNWRVGVLHPHLHEKLAAVIETNDLAVATSGTYARGQHIFDPHTRERPTGVLSVTIVGPDLATADAYATASYAMGLNGPSWSATLSGYQAMTILADDTVLSTPGFPAV